MDITDNPLWRAKDILDDNYVILTREQLRDLIEWLNRAAHESYPAETLFEEWSVDYLRRVFGQPLQQNQSV